jgi:hypothetical protein
MDFSPGFGPSIQALDISKQQVCGFADRSSLHRLRLLKPTLFGQGLQINFENMASWHLSSI